MIVVSMTIRKGKYKLYSGLETKHFVSKYYY